ncbi:hypothetical protein JTE90_003635 [Oedothorax gibbosus]|uniref:Uncharacterized protein n=1 Tax=Oedothorax gibbosus TaxID=931172 RepID=A0AAV6TNB7_9ARAC|nr:hypothetical protein JTE90_003635 [Oedothorax gibbosus]
MFTACSSPAGLVPLSSSSPRSEDIPKDSDRSKSSDRKKHASDKTLSTYFSKSQIPKGSLVLPTTQSDLPYPLNKNQSGVIPQGLGGTSAQSPTSSSSSVSSSGPTLSRTSNSHVMHSTSSVTNPVPNQLISEKMDIPPVTSDAIDQAKIAAANLLNISPYLT